MLWIELFILCVLIALLLFAFRAGVFRLKWTSKPVGRNVPCSECGGMGIVQLENQLPFTRWHRENWTIQQMGTRGSTCRVCGGLEAIFEVD